MKIILFLGYSGSGKTTALTVITKEIKKARLGKIGTIKHVHDESFTIDSKGKDTWLHADAGASVVVAVSPKEIAIIKKPAHASFSELFKIFSSEKVRYLLIEGFHSKLKGRRGVKRIVCAKSFDDARDLIKIHKENILFVTGVLTLQGEYPKSVDGVPVLSLSKEMKTALRLIQGKI